MNFATLNGLTLHHQMTGDPAHQPTIIFSNSLGTDFRKGRHYRRVRENARDRVL